MAQTPSAPSNVDYFLVSSNTLVHNDTTSYPILYPLMDDTLNPVFILGDVDIILEFDVGNTQTTDSIKLEVGITEDGIELISTTFKFDPLLVNGLIPGLVNYGESSIVPNITYTRSGNRVSLTIQSIESGEFFCRLWAKEGSNASAQGSPAEVGFINL